MQQCLECYGTLCAVPSKKHTDATLLGLEGQTQHTVTAPLGIERQAEYGANKHVFVNTV